MGNWVLIYSESHNRDCHLRSIRADKSAGATYAKYSIYRPAGPTCGCQGFMDYRVLY